MGSGGAPELGGPRVRVLLASLVTEDVDHFRAYNDEFDPPGGVTNAGRDWVATSSW